MCISESFTAHRTNHRIRGHDRGEFHNEEGRQPRMVSAVSRQSPPTEPVPKDLLDVKHVHRIHPSYCRKKPPRYMPARQHITFEYRSPQEPSPTIRRIFPRTTLATAPQSRQRSSSISSLFRGGRMRESARATGQQRERRTPTAEQISLQRWSSAPARTVDVLHYRDMESRKDSWRRRSKQVRFLGETKDDVERRDKSNFAGPKESRRNKSLREKSFSAHITSGYDPTRGEPRTTAGDPGTCAHVRPTERIKEIRRNHTLHEAPRARPKIIQNGHRQILEAGIRVCNESRSRQNRMDFQDCRTPRNRASSYVRAFDSGDATIHSSRSHRQPYQHWRWR